MAEASRNSPNISTSGEFCWFELATSHQNAQFVELLAKGRDAALAAFRQY
jgi:hypothetical protein